VTSVQAGDHVIPCYQVCGSTREADPAEPCSSPLTAAGVQERRQKETSTMPACQRVEWSFPLPVCGALTYECQVRRRGCPSFSLLQAFCGDCKFCFSKKTNLCGSVRQWTGNGVMKADGKVKEFPTQRCPQPTCHTHHAHTHTHTHPPPRTVGALKRVCGTTTLQSRFTCDGKPIFHVRRPRRSPAVASVASGFGLLGAVGRTALGGGGDRVGLLLGANTASSAGAASYRTYAS